jgi:hypothetical protein
MYRLDRTTKLIMLLIVTRRKAKKIVEYRQLEISTDFNCPGNIMGII